MWSSTCFTCISRSPLHIRWLCHLGILNRPFTHRPHCFTTTITDNSQIIMFDVRITATHVIVQSKSSAQSVLHRAYPQTQERWVAWISSLASGPLGIGRRLEVPAGHSVAVVEQVLAEDRTLWHSFWCLLNVLAHGNRFHPSSNHSFGFVWVIFGFDQ